MNVKSCLLLLSGFLATARGDSLTLVDGSEVACESVKVDKAEVVYVSEGKETRLPRAKVVRMTDERTEEEKKAALAHLLKDWAGQKEVKHDNWGKLFKITESNCLRAETTPAYQYIAPMGWYQNNMTRMDEALTVYSYMEAGPKVRGHITVTHRTKEEYREGTEADEFKENIEANEGLLKNLKLGEQKTFTVGKWTVMQQAFTGIDRQTGNKRRGYEALVAIGPKAGLAITLIAPDDKDFARREQVYKDVIASLVPLAPAG